MRYRAYEAYKDSGVEWLGEVPEGWEISRIKFFASLNPSKSKVKKLPEDELVSFLPMESIGEKGELYASQTKPIAELLSGYTYVADNDVIIAKITPCFENGKGAIAVGLENGVGFATTEVIPLRCKKNNNNHFLYYCLSTPPFRYLAEGAMYGAGGQKRVSDSFVANYKFSVPTVHEQTAIATFLDKETAKIDRLIEKQEELIKLLQEKRQAVISHAVTKGLDPNVKMKDSGVEWLGKVPEGWEVKRIKHLLLPEKGSIKTGPFGSHLTSKDMEGADVKVINQRSIIDNDFGAGDNFISHEKYVELKNFKIYAGDIIITTRGTIGRTAIAPDNIPEAILHPCLMRLQLNERKYLKELIKLIIQDARYFMEQLKVLSNATTIDVIYSENLRNVTIALPSTVDEQECVLRDIERQCQRIDELIEKSREASNLLKERRTALISAAVTGKIDVRHHASHPAGDMVSSGSVVHDEL